MRWAWIRPSDGVALEVTDVDPEGRYPVEMQWQLALDATATGDRWVDGTWHAAPPPKPSASARLVSSKEFLALFTPAQQSALWSADPLLMSGALRVITKGSANLDSPDLANLLALAVSKGALSEPEKARVIAGEPAPAAAA